MLNNIRTSLANKTTVTELTNKLQLGAENVIAKLAIAYSLAVNEKLDINTFQRDSKGKEYTAKVLFGTNNISIYVAMVCQKYQLQKTSNDVVKYLKLHLDDGLEKLKAEYEKSSGLNSVDFFMPKIENGLNYFNL